MKNIIILLNILICTITTLTAQNSLDAPAKTVIKWSPLSLVNPVAPAFQFGIERQFAENWTHQHELGFLWDGNDLYDGDFFGVRLQNEIRYYIPRESNSFDFFFLKYLLLQLTGRHLNYRGEEVTVWRNNRAFRQLIDVDANYNELSILVGTGKVVYFKNAPIMIEYGSAIGARFINRYFYDLPEGADIDRNTNNIFWDPLSMDLEVRPFPTLNVYFKIGYILN